MVHNKGKIKIGVSSCLIGEKVRYNGEHKQDRYVLEVLGKIFEYVPVCPEMEVGMGVPRETVVLYGSPENPRMTGRKSGTDWTGKMNRYVKGRVSGLAAENLCGYIFKNRSPSCGLGGIPVYSEPGSNSVRRGRGMFAEAFMEKFPLVPVEDEGRLNNPKKRENFIVRVLSFFKLRDLMEKKFSAGSLVKFHTSHKFLILAHNKKYYDSLEQLVGNARSFKAAELKARYSKLFMEALTYKSTRKKNTDALINMLEFLKKSLTREENKNILESIEDYRKERVPLAVPVRLIRDEVKKHNVSYLSDQVYLNTHTKESMLRNHV